MILTINAGSSSIKLAAFEPETFERRASQTIDLAHDRDHDKALERGVEALVATLGPTTWTTVGHRIVHGGEFLGPRQIDNALLAKLHALTPFAPLHQPHGLAGIMAACHHLPDATQVACFDTSFHRTIPDVARHYALPREYHDLVAYGFHGLSYEYIASALPAEVGPRVIVAHLGSGASMCAMRNRTSIATTMGLTALDGLVMATRPGTLDPGVVLHMVERGMSAREIRDILYQQSGLLGISGTTGQMHELLASETPRARLAVEMFVYRATRAVGSLASALGGLDAIVFTGGIGEHSAVIRDRILAGLHWIPGVQSLVIPTNEELVIARHAFAIR
ncbi:MAG: hypothetical protein QM831_36395 [Kofleriaceae bacterium]